MATKVKTKETNKKTATQTSVETKEKVVETKSKKQSPKPKLTGGQRFWYIFLCIITFSIFYFVIQSKIKKANQQSFDTNAEPTSDTSKQLKRTEKIPFDVNKLIEYLGNKENILTVDASLSSLKVGVKEKEKVNQEEIKKLGSKGIMISGLKVSIVFGDVSIAVKEALEKKLGF